jgi:hypothetical protein
MTTFKYWMVANFEILAVVVAGFISILLVLCFYNEEQHPDMSTGNMIGMVIFISFLICMQGKSRYTSLIKYLIVLLFCVIAAIVIFVGPIEDEGFKIPRIVAVFFVIFFVAGTIIGVKLAIFTNRNIDEIVSRRMLYRNSSVALFEIKWVYTLDRFAGVASSITLCLGSMTYLIYYL